ncbi:MAG: AAA family ATPase [Bacilli bacterium]|nr:AAA family ATPase [Bacilli bacterium]
MAITNEEYKKEEKILEKVISLFDETYNSLADDVKVGEEDLIEFKKMMWSDSNSFDEGEMTQVKAATALEADKFFRKQDYLRRLRMIKNKPYFASIVFKDDKDNTLYNIYMSLTYLKDKNSNNILYDWRSPICSLFYDYETGPCSYSAPGGVYTGELKRKRQYKIENRKLLGVFDNSLNIDDEVLQEVLATESSDKMKNVVNTIQQEQNKVIRNLEDNNLIVQGIAGSGKTTVALHRIAFLLYRLDNLNSNNVLIFSPNNIFTDYISEVLPSLGEANTLQTTFADYLENFITEYNHVEDFTDFVSRFYSYNEINPELVLYKQSDRIIDDLDAFIEDYVSNCEFINSFNESEKYYIVKDDLNYMLHDKYDRLPLFERMEEMAAKLSSNNYKGSNKKKATYLKLMYENSNFKHDLKDIMKEFYLSEYCRFKLDDKTINKFIYTDSVNYEDALVFAYLKGRLEGFIYEGNIKQVVIDEAQDYNRLQYIIINEIFRKADFTILGDINQNINPYYHYDSLEDLANLFRGDTKYIELLKTYRSSPEIINYTNKILGLNHVNAIRKTLNKPVIIRKGVEDIRNSLIEDISKLKSEYKSVALITKDMKEAEGLYDLVKDSLEISLVDHNTKSFHKDLVIMPAYVSKGLEFDSVIVYNNRDNSYKNNERNLLYVACTRAQHELYIYN